MIKDKVATVLLMLLISFGVVNIFTIKDSTAWIMNLIGLICLISVGVFAIILKKRNEKLKR